MSDFRDEGQLDTSQVEDRRGRSLGGRPAVVGGGGARDRDRADHAAPRRQPARWRRWPTSACCRASNNQPVGEGAPTTPIAQKCQTGADAETNEDCRAVAYVNSINNFWETAFVQYQPAQTVFFSGSTSTGCGTRQLRGRAVLLPGRPEGVHRPRLPDGAARPVRREGGAVHARLHPRARVRPPRPGPARRRSTRCAATSTGPNSAAVRSELQADCYAGVWASQTRRFGVTLKAPTAAEIADAVDAAAAVGDDRIQKATQGQVNPETWTHGSAAQRVKWLTRGLRVEGPDPVRHLQRPDLSLEPNIPGRADQVTAVANRYLKAGWLPARTCRSCSTTVTGAPVRAVTRTLDRSGVSFYVDAEMPVPALGTEIAFEARIGGGAARGRAVVLKVEHMDDGVGREMVVVCDVLELHGAAERAIQRAGFRERVVEFADEASRRREDPRGGRRRAARGGCARIRRRSGRARRTGCRSRTCRSPRRSPRHRPFRAASASRSAAAPRRSRSRAASARVPPGTTGRSRTGSSRRLVATAV